MDLLWQGIVLGLVLSLMVGPILFTLIQTSLDRGTLGGLMIALGFWMSDIMFITLIFKGFSYVQNVVQLPNFSFYGGMIGATILIAIGVGMLLNKSINRTVTDANYRPRKRHTLWLWVKGFFMNTFNPFTVFFWIALVSNGLGYEQFTFDHVGTFFIGLMGVLIISDILKVLGASYLRKWLTDTTILKIRKVSGLALILFGIVLIIRVSS